MQTASDPRPARNVVSGLLLAAATCCLTPPVHGQSFAGAPILRPMALPDQPSSGAPATDRPAEIAARPVQRLPARIQGWKIEGASGRLDWPLYVPRGRERSGATVRITYRTDISVLPESSPLTLSINGAPIGSTTEPASVRRTVEFVVPPGLLAAGYNVLSIAADHRHRVDCSLSASYELWTEIDPALSGLIYPDETSAIAGLDDLPALPLRKDGALHIRIVTVDRLGPQDVERALRAAQAVALAAGTMFPVVDYGTALADDAVNLRLGSGRQDVAGSAPADETRRPLGGGVTIDDEPGRSAVTLTFARGSDAELDAAIAALASLPKPAGSPEGRQLVERDRGVEGGEQTAPLVGATPLTFEAGRHAVVLPVRLPADFYPADYDRAVLRLSGEWLPGAASAQGRVAVRMNGSEVASWPLPSAGGPFTRHPIHLPLSMFRPGLDRLEVEASLQSNAGDTCGLPGDRGPRLRLMVGSEASFPRLARIGRFPDLAQFAAGGSAGSGGRTIRLVVPRPDRDSMSAAATLLARLTVASGRLLPFVFSLSATPSSGEDALIVASADALRPELLQVVRLDPDRVARSWKQEPRDRRSADPIATGALRRRMPGCADPGEADGAAIPIVSPSTAERAGPLDRMLATVFATYGSVLDQLGRSPAPEAPGSQESAVIAQGIAETGARVTLLTGRASADLRDAASCLANPALWAQLAGGATFVQDGAGTLRPVLVTNPSFFASQPPGFVNFRLIGAGWLSTHPLAVAAATLALLALLTGSTAHLLRRIGRRQA